MRRQPLLVNAGRLRETLDTFAQIGGTDNNGVTRLALTKEDILARDTFRACCEEIGMTVESDDMGNVCATLAGVQDAPPIVMGSHLDSVKKGGRFDGVLGVIAGLEVVRTLIEHEVKPCFPITIVNFTNEEGARFEPSMMASGVLSGKFEKSSMLNKTDSEGVSFEAALKASGYEGSIANRIAEATAYLELHIEQGPCLDQEGLSIGVVECVVGMVCYEIEITGESNHAGTTPMTMRKDAFFEANDRVSELRRQLDLLGDGELVYTMGRVQVYPNIHTVIPNKVVFTIEARHKNEDILREVERIIAGLNNGAGDGGCTIRISKLWSRNTVWFDPDLCSRIEQSARALGYSYRRMVSGAGHDAQFTASFLPSAMIFVPSVNGKSHCEEELTPYEDCAKGANVLLETVMAILD
ncbi:Zn-dependent hydrolase [Paenibacillus sp. LHD-117]|uniref:Zn-dependent hydrolase n=1 Tax=Paenibacillus sp. LHD-117 TaxID=3071412 RepID=UPI0027E0F45E|nr:Zn-dependent hydrolase [Paenibacillus sp. LHD-117]MDQ6419343.1 Zn-dependent hydrolase [Paenibacillus sp. LHD-117]